MTTGEAWDKLREVDAEIRAARALHDSGADEAKSLDFRAHMVELAEERARLQQLLRDGKLP